MAKLTARQQRFTDEYLIDLNATQAAIRAGYSPHTAGQIGDQNLKKVEIKKRIDEMLEKIHNEKIADATEVMQYLTSVLRGTSTAEIVVVEGTGDGCSSARKVPKSPDEKERLKAAELIGKRYRLFTDNVSLDGVVPIVLCGEEELK